MYINFQQNPVYRPCIQIYLQKIASCINLQLPIEIYKKNRLFQTCVIVKRTCMPPWVSKSVKTANTNLFAKNGKLHKFANYE